MCKADICLITGLKNRHRVVSVCLIMNSVKYALIDKITQPLNVLFSVFSKQLFLKRKDNHIVPSILRKIRQSIINFCAVNE